MPESSDNSNFFNFNFDRIKGTFSTKRNITINNDNFWKILPMFDKLLNYINEIKIDSVIVKEVFEIPLSTLTSEYVTISPNLRCKIDGDGGIIFDFLEFKDLKSCFFKFMNTDNDLNELYLDYNIYKTDENQEKYSILKLFLDVDIISNLTLVTL